MIRRRVAILAGGRSSEHDVSLASAQGVEQALRSLGVEVTTIAIGRGGHWVLSSGPEDGALEQGPGAEAVAAALVPAGMRLPGRNVADALAGVDVVFPLLHGPFGEDGTVQGLLELAGVPYVGAGVTASAVAMDKDMLKAVLRDRGIPVARNITLRAGEAIHNPFPYPVFVKPARLGSSVGISKANDREGLEAAVELALRHDEKILVEQFVDGVEVEVGVLGNHDPVASLPGEISVTHNEWYDYEAKYAEGEMELFVPARISEQQTARAQELALAAFAAVECEGMARVDMFVSRAGDVLVNELNTIPGFTQTSVYAKLFEASGVDYRTLVERLIDLALERHARRARLAY